jgi:DNA polymerase (family X)
MRRIRRVTNTAIADVLERVAGLLTVQHANAWRIAAYRRAAASIREHPRALRAELDEGGMEALEAIPGIGRGIASAIRELLATGRLGLLDRLEGQVTPEDLFTLVPGIGEVLAARIHTELGIDTLEELELAAHDGRLEAVAGFGPRRTASIRASLDALLSPSVRRRARRIAIARPMTGTSPQADAVVQEPAGPAGSTDTPGEQRRPAVDLLLDVDLEYRHRVYRGDLRRIAPRRFNPTGRAWLPILHTEREGWHFTALFSNTSTAHELEKTRDWVVIYFDRDGDEDQVTVVTEYRGPLAGRRVVRGREAECRDWYDRPAPPARESRAAQPVG